MVYLGYDNPKIPEKWGQNFQKWKDLHPGFTVKLWNKEDVLKLIADEDPSFLPVYENYPYGIQRSDACRPFILRKYGGIYADLDTSPVHSFENVLRLYEEDPEVEVLLATSPTTSTPTNHLMVSKPNSHFWDEIIEAFKKNATKKRFLKHTAVMVSTGPEVYRKMLPKYEKKRPKSVQVIPPEILDSESMCSRDEGSPFRYLKNDHAGSWNTKGTKAINKLNCGFLKPVSSTLDKPGLLVTILFLAAIIAILVGALAGLGWFFFTLTVYATTLAVIVLVKGTRRKC